MVLSAGCGNSQEARYQRYLEEVHDSNSVEFIPQVRDSVEADGEEEDEWLGGDDDGLVAVPDIPQERRVNMNANDYDAMREFSGKGGAE